MQKMSKGKKKERLQRDIFRIVEQWTLLYSNVIDIQYTQYNNMQYTIILYIIVNAMD